MHLLKRLLLVVGLATLLFFSRQSARAIPIQGNIDFTGSAAGTQSGGTSTLMFNNPMTVIVATGDFAGIALGTSVAFAPLSWTGSGNSAQMTSDHNPVWSILLNGTTYEFTLLSLENAIMTAEQLSLSGTGISRISGAVNRDPTFFAFNISADGSGFNYAINIPEPGTIGLLFCGAAALGLMTAKRALRRR